MKKQLSGFSLIELLIVLTIIGILASIAYPNYMDYLLRSKLTEPRAKLGEMRVKLEQYYQDNRTYLGACVAGTTAPLPTDAQYFVYSCPTLQAETYVVRADGLGFRYELNQDNTRSTPTVPAGWTSSANCWVRSKDGGC